jgi:hypothetical protein
MKNTSFKIVVLSLIALSFAGCNNFLDKNPISQLTNSTLGSSTTDSVRFTTAAQAEALLAACYADYRTELYELDLFVNGDMHSDNSYYGATGNPDYPQIDSYNVDATNGNIKRDWVDLYLMVSHCNTVIINVPRIADAALTTTRKSQIVAEASFIRAWAYFDLIRLFGNVPLVLQEVPAINAENITQVYPILYPPQAEQSAVYSQIITDLQTALAGVPVTAANKGFVTKGAVNAMLAKVYATRSPQDWQKVSSYCDAVINGGYSLVSNYDYLWDDQHKNSSEAIFEIQYDGNWNTGTGNWGASMFLGVDWKKFDTPSHDLVNAFKKEGDLVRYQSSIKWQDVSGTWTDTNWPANNYPFCYKMRDNSSAASDIILLRLADILLLKAEALNELGQTAQAAPYLNQVRNRVNLSNTTASTQSDMRLAIEKERFLELAFEGQRWFDLVRTGRAIAVLNKAEGGIYNGKVISTNMIYPIPQSQLDLNANLKQNPGY